MAKEDKDEGFGFGGRSEGGDARDVFERHYGEDAWKSKHLGPNYEHKYRGKDGTELGNGSFAERDHKRFEADRAWAAASGAWVTKANEHAEKLYNEDNMDFNDMKKYAALAGVSDINSENDVSAIREAYNNAHTSEDEMQSAISAMRDELTESVENGGDQTAAEHMSFNDYLENSDAQTSDGAEGAAEGAQAMLSDNVKAIAADKQAMGRSKTNMGKYVLSNLKSDTYGGAE